MTDITYRVEGDYRIPELVLDGEEYEDSSEEAIRRYGELRERFLREINSQAKEEVVLREIVYQ